MIDDDSGDASPGHPPALTVGELRRAIEAAAATGTRSEAAARIARSLRGGLARTVGTATYWVWHRSNLLAMDEQLGVLPTFFVTRSAPYLWWKDLLRLLGVTLQDSIQARIDAVGHDRGGVRGTRSWWIHAGHGQSRVLRRTLWGRALSFPPHV